MVYITKGLSESCWGVVLREVRLETETVITVELPRASPGRRQALWQPDRPAEGRPGPGSAAGYEGSAARRQPEPTAARASVPESKSETCSLRSTGWKFSRLHFAQGGTTLWRTKLLEAGCVCVREHNAMIGSSIERVSP